MCCRTDQCLDVLEQQMRISRRNMEIIHSQRDELLLEFPDVPVFPPVEDPYTSLTPAELAAFGVGPSRALASYNDDEEEAVDDEEEMKDDE
jgi:hypothetical protein